MPEEELAGHRREGCPPLERRIRKLAEARRWAWMDEAPCEGYDVGWFVPDAGSRRSPSGSGPVVEGIAFNRLTHGERLAKSQWCVRCPVRSECLAFAFSTKSAHVIFGGATWDERRRVLRLSLADRLRVLQELLTRQCVTEGLVPSRRPSATVSGAGGEPPGMASEM